MNDPGIDPRLLDVLQHASNLQLFQLNSVIERMLADPRRILQVRKDLHMGQTVRFMDWRDGRMRTGKVIAMKDTQLIVHEEGTRSSWTVPYTAVEPPAPDAARPAAPAEPPPPPRASRNDFRCGEKVAFEDKHLNTVVGTIVRINQRTASIDPGDGTTWRVGFALLRHVVDSDLTDASSRGPWGNAYTSRKLRISDTDSQGNDDTWGARSVHSGLLQ